MQEGLLSTILARTIIEDLWHVHWGGDHRIPAKLCILSPSPPPTIALMTSPDDFPHSIIFHLHLHFCWSESESPHLALHTMLFLTCSLLDFSAQAQLKDDEESEWDDDGVDELCSEDEDVVPDVIWSSGKDPAFVMSSMVDLSQKLG